MSDGIVIEWLGGNCPVQAEGTIDDKRFYFRARGEHWSLEVHPTAGDGCEYLKWPDDPKEWRHEEEWGDGPYDAGWMPEDVAREKIIFGAGLYQESLRPAEKDKGE